MREVKPYPSYAVEKFSLMINDTEVPTAEASLAIALVERWGLVMGDDDGEDSSGRQKGKLMPVADVVARACETADLTMQELRKRGWFVTAPTIAEAEAMTAKKQTERA